MGDGRRQGATDPGRISHPRAFEWRRKIGTAVVSERPAGRQTERSRLPLAVQLILKLRLKAAGLPEILSAHSFRGLVVTDLLSYNVPLEDVQYLASEHHRPQRGFVKGGVPKRGKQI